MRLSIERVAGVLEAMAPAHRIDGRDAETPLRAADAALYDAKSAVKNTCRLR